MKRRDYSERWSEDKVKKLINARITKEKQFTRKNVDLKSLWEEIGQELGSKEGWRKIRKRWTNVVDKYKRIIEPPTGQGTEDGEIATDWPHFNTLFYYFTNKHTINPPLVIDSSAATEQRRSTLSPCFTDVQFLEELIDSRSVNDSSLDMSHLATTSTPRSSTSTTPTPTASISGSRKTTKLLEDKALRSVNKCCKVIEMYFKQKHGIVVSSDSE